MDNTAYYFINKTRKKLEKYNPSGITNKTIKKCRRITRETFLKIMKKIISEKAASTRWAWPPKARSSSNTVRGYSKNYDSVELASNNWLFS